MATLTLGAFGSGLRGKTSSTVFVQTAGGVVVRDRVIPANPQTPAQQANRYRLARATQAWSKLGPEHIAAWEAYAQRLAVRDPGSGLMRAPRPQNLFVKLYAKLLQLNPEAGVPGYPPENPFFGDNISLTVGLSNEDLTTDNKRLSTDDLTTDDLGGILFSASAPNAPGVTTELLLQPLESGVRRTYLEKYRHATFFAFEEGTLSVKVPVPTPGWYACGYRFVNSVTGQDTGVVEAGKILVD